MLHKKLISELNKQINIEFESAYLYLSMSIYCDAQGLTGFANWLRVQAQEETSHGMKIYRYMTDRGAPATLDAIAKPKSDFSSLKQIFEMALANEQKLDERFNKLSSLAHEHKDHTTVVFLQWFLTEQVEEIALCTSVLDKLSLISGDKRGFYMLDREFAARTPE